MLWWLMVGYLVVTLTIMTCLLLTIGQHLLKLRRAKFQQVATVADDGSERVAMIEQ